MTYKILMDKATGKQDFYFQNTKTFIVTRDIEGMFQETVYLSFFHFTNKLFFKRTHKKL